MGPGHCEENEGKKGADAAIENGWAHLDEGLPDSFIAATGASDVIGLRHEGVRDVNAIVDAETDGDDDEDAADRVDRHAPEVHEAADVDDAHDDHEEDENRIGDAGEEGQGDDEHAEDGEAEVPVQLEGDDLISFPDGVT